MQKEAVSQLLFLPHLPKSIAFQKNSLAIKPPSRKTSHTADITPITGEVR